MYGSLDMRHVDFRWLTGSQRTPWVWGVTIHPWDVVCCISVSCIMKSHMSLAHCVSFLVDNVIFGGFSSRIH